MPATTPPRYGGLQLTSATFLILSVSLNVFFASNWIWARLSNELGLRERKAGLLFDQILPIAGWSRRASDDAEAAALFNCSDNGDLYIDTDVSTADFDYRPFGSQEMNYSCECYECFSGPRCTDAVENCSANVDRQEAGYHFMKLDGCYFTGFFSQ